jgi:hypothetical protein
MVTFGSAPPEEVQQIIFLFAGAPGGSGKTLLASILLDWLRYCCFPPVAVRAFDLDPHRGLSRFCARLERVGDFKVRELLGLILADRVHSCFLIDSPGGSSEDFFKSVFCGYDVADLAFKGVQVVLVVPVTTDGDSFKNISPWMQLPASQIVLVYRMPAAGSGWQVSGAQDVSDLSDLPLPLWLQMSGASVSALHGLLDGQSRIKRLIEPHFKPEALVRHLFQRGIPLYQAAYPYSAWSRRELSVAEQLLRRQKLNASVGQYWGPKRRYWGVGAYFGHQLAVSLGFFHRQVAMVFSPWIASLKEKASYDSLTS